MKIRYILIIIISLFSVSDYGQVDQDDIRQELKKLEVDEDEVLKRLRQRGFDVENIDPSDTDMLLQLQAATDEVIKEIQIERTQEQPSVSNEIIVVKSDTIEPQKDILIQDNDTTQNTLDKSPKKDRIDAIYGQQLYQNNSIRFYKKSEYINTPSNYILGPGDKVSVSIWGNAEANFNEELTDEGFIKLDRQPRIALGGLKLKDAKALVKSNLAKSYNDFRGSQFEMKVSANRNINVFITGEVKNVGSYNISAVNTAVNALSASGGPSGIGSVRNIQIISENSASRKLDLYAFLNNPQSNRELYLNDGDAIVVPVQGDIVDIKGAIKRPFQYEVLSNESLADLIKLAGGLNVNALRKNVKITRFQNDKKIILNVDISNMDNAVKFDLQNGDVVQILQINEEIKNAVSVLGAVNNEGKFSIGSQTRISDLMAKVVLKDDVILQTAYLTRLNDDKRTVSYRIINIENALTDRNSKSNILLQNGDEITIRGKSNFSFISSFEVKGAVNKAGKYQLDGDAELKISDAIFLSDGINPDATNFGYIIRNIPGTTSTEYLAVNLKNAINNPNSSDNINIRPGDIIQVYEKEQYLDETYITIEGAVREPQSLKYDKSLTLKDLILLAKGLTFDAAPNKIDIFRLQFKNNNKTKTLIAHATVNEDLNITSGTNIQLEAFDQIVVRKAPEFEFQRKVYLDGEVKYPGLYYLLSDNYKVVDLIKEAGGLTDEAFAAGATVNRTQNGVGYIICDLVDALDSPRNSSNIILQKGDTIYIPKRQNLVSVRGEVNINNVFNSEVSSSQKVSYVFEKGKRAKHYIDMSGGFTKNADKNSLSVRYPNGELHKTKKILFFRIYPKVPAGSQIIVNSKEAKEIKKKSEKENTDWNKILSNSIAQATTILSLILLLQNVD